MALVQAKELFRAGFVQKVARFVSPPNPSGQTSFLWRSDSFSMQKRALLMARMVEFKTSLFSATPAVSPSVASVADLHTSPAREGEVQPDADGVEKTVDVTSAGTSSSETDSGLLDRSYGQEQADHHKIAESSHDQHMSTKDDEEHESLERTGYDISKMSRPTGDE